MSENPFTGRKYKNISNYIIYVTKLQEGTIPAVSVVIIRKDKILQTFQIINGPRLGNE
jgi:hypothetical protein